MKHQHVADTAVGNLSVLLGPDDLPRLRREAPRTEQMHDFHHEIRNLMSILETGALEDGTLVDGALEDADSVVNLAVEWPNWENKKSIAKHKSSEIIVGPGIVSFTAEFIPDESHGTLGCLLRLALVLRQSDGGWVFLLPGSEPNSDARPQCFESRCPQESPWFRIAPIPMFDHRALQHCYQPCLVLQHHCES